MAATPRPCCRIASRCCSSSTSWILQNGHQSAERKNTSMAPFGPMTELRVWFRPSWSGAERAGTCCPTSGPVLMLWPYSAAIGSAQIAIVTRDLDAMQTQNVNVSSSAIMMTGGPPDDIFTALAKVALPPSDCAHCWSASMDGKCTSATR